MSAKSPQHLAWLKFTGKTLQSKDKKIVEIWEIAHTGDQKILSAWAKHFRNHYCLDSELGRLMKGTGKNEKQFLEEIKFPDKSKSPGPSIRSGDFAEILVADYVQFKLGYIVPRTRYINKTVRNESEKGCDIIGYKFHSADTFSEQDELIIFEAKAKLTGNSFEDRLQEAVDHSAKDILRKAESLNAIKQRFLDKSQDAEADKIERFQNSEDNKYIEIHGAAAIVLTENCIDDDIKKTTAKDHPNNENIKLIVIHGKDLMNLVHALYKRAADEAKA